MNFGTFDKKKWKYAKTIQYLGFIFGGPEPKLFLNWLLVKKLCNVFHFVDLSFLLIWNSAERHTKN